MKPHPRNMAGSTASSQLRMGIAWPAAQSIRSSRFCKRPQEGTEDANGFCEFCASLWLLFAFCRKRSVAEFAGGEFAFHRVFAIDGAGVFQFDLGSLHIA